MSRSPALGYHSPKNVFFLFLLNKATALFQVLTNTSFTTKDLTGECVNALSSDIDCSPTVASLQVGAYHPETTLNRTCTAECGQSLAQYTARVAQACKKQTWNGYEDTAMPLEIIPDMLQYHYNLTCLSDSGRYCNVVASKAAAVLDTQGIASHHPLISRGMSIGRKLTLADF